MSGQPKGLAILADTFERVVFDGLLEGAYVEERAQEEHDHVLLVGDGRYLHRNPDGCFFCKSKYVNEYIIIVKYR